ncbi:hypothetical protein DFJ63DRAFT_290997 [Scheffersomyces coipomensis]|uniref:uncharacterized protein n=1 Tax=Scheffersomyces coipomensis TaxID=1788519 RepID=UPI00315C6096
MAKEKRTKPCSNCKRSKVKCIYNNSLPCERCIKTGQSINCQFVPKLPSLKLPPFNKNDSTHEVSLPPLSVSGVGNRTSGSHALSNAASTPTTQQQQQQSQQSQSQSQSQILPPPLPPSIQNSKTQWKSQMEDRMNNVDNKLNDLVEILKMNQQYLLESQRRLQQPTPQPPPHYTPINPSPLPRLSTSPPQEPIVPPPSINSQNLKRIMSESNLNTHKKQKIDIPEDFRLGYLSKEEATELFKFFDTNISQQLFGFEISKISIDSIWDSCPLLVCAICAISSIHHPKLGNKSATLQKYLHHLCSTILYKGKPTNETDGFNTIVALVFCSFWLTDSQMFTGLALQLAKEFGLNNPYTSNKEKLKLWYLLYVLDGQQSLTFNRQPLVNSQEYSLKNSREILLSKKLAIKSSVSQNNLLTESDEKNNDDEDDDDKEKQSERFTDMRLVSQVEYNQALNEAFRGNAWDLLVPSSFGIPSKSNLELDRWMVSWTVLLAPGNNGTVWSSKSTLIYYNFAKMHINSTAVRQLQINPSDDGSMLPKWDVTKMQTDKRIESSSSDSSSNQNQSLTVEDEDEFISNKELMSEDETIINANIAVIAAQTVLNLVINDNDILDNLKYVPVHIHIMLYYAALLLLNPPFKSNNKSINFSEKDYYLKVLENLKIVKNLQKKIYTNLPIDIKFGNRLIKSLDQIIDEKLSNIKQFVNELSGNDEDKLLLERQIMVLTDDTKNIVEIFDQESMSKSTTPERIAAWPGSNHGHP